MSKGVKERVEILYEDRKLLVVYKPAGLLVQGDRTGDPSLLDLVRDYLKEKYDKPGRVYLGLVHRLDRVTSGLVVLARTSKVAARLSEAFREGEIAKAYLAVVEGRLGLEAGVFRHYLRWESSRGRTLVRKRPAPGFQEALTAFHTLESFSNHTALLLFPETGRKHQLRAQWAFEGYPIVGDRRYGSKTRVLSGRALLLHALALAFRHPSSQKPLFFWAPPPVYFPALSLDPEELRSFLYRRQG